MNSLKWYAIQGSGSGVVAVGDSYDECSKSAAKATGRDRAPGTVAPYFIVTENWFDDGLHDAYNII